MLMAPIFATKVEDHENEYVRGNIISKFPYFRNGGIVQFIAPAILVGFRAILIDICNVSSNRGGPYPMKK